MTSTPSRYERPRGLLSILTIAVVIGVVSLVLAVQNAVAINAQANQHNIERIAADYQSCQRGNAFRQQSKDIAQANAGLIGGIVDTVLPPTDGTTQREQSIQAIRAKLDPLFTDYATQVAEIKISDCDALYPDGRAAVAKL